MCCHYTADGMIRWRWTCKLTSVFCVPQSERIFVPNAPKRYKERLRGLARAEGLLALPMLRFR
jgi:hypothetical protein